MLLPFGKRTYQDYEDDVSEYDELEFALPSAIADPLGLGGLLAKQALTGQRMNPNDATQAMIDIGMLSAPIGLLGGVPKGAVLGANVFQGGPHKYGPEGAAESLKHMSKGEGAQAYGYGRYDAESKGVADDYRKNLSGGGRVLNVDGVENPSELLKSAMTTQGSPEEYIKQARLGLAHVKKRMDNANKKDEGLGFSEHDMERMEYDKRLKDIQELETYVGKDISFGDAGHIYKHDLPDEDIARYLDWDKKLSEQPKAAKSALYGENYANGMDIDESIKSLVDDVNARPDRAATDAEKMQMTLLTRLKHGDDPSGQVFYHDMKSKAQRAYDADPSAAPNDAGMGASEALGKAGIPGLKYFDGMSRVNTKAKVLIDGVSDSTGAGGWVLRQNESNPQKALSKAINEIESFGKPLQGSARETDLATLKMWKKSPNSVEISNPRTRNFVTWDQDVLNRMKLLERNGEKFGGLLTR